jgi:hypothetical protein
MIFKWLIQTIFWFKFFKDHIRQNLIIQIITDNLVWVFINNSTIKKKFGKKPNALLLQKEIYFNWHKSISIELFAAKFNFLDAISVILN